MAVTKILNGRYLRYIADGKIVAMTGLSYNKEYDALEIDWTGTLRSYRHKGYMQELFKRLLQSTDEDIYCNCWKLEDSVINSHTLMDLFNSTCVISPRATYSVAYNCGRDKHSCINCSGSNCKCYEDLYLRRRPLIKSEVKYFSVIKLIATHASP